MKVISLNGTWNLKSENGKIRTTGIVPGDVYGDLLQNKLIPDPYYRDNEGKLQWIGETGWIYSRSFKVSGEILKSDMVLLQCEGLDTFASIRINGIAVAITENMFRCYEWDVRNCLKQGDNKIEISFISILPYAKENQKKHYLFCCGTTPAGYDSNWIYRKPHKIINVATGWARKEQCNFGWDWGPMLLTCGIWKDIRLIASNKARIKDIHITQAHKKNNVTLSVGISVEKNHNAPVSALIEIRKAGKTVASKSINITNSSTNIELPVKNPELWWPNGMGRQPLYDVTVELSDENETLDTVSKRIGLRTIRLERRRDKWGESFEFTANNVPMFAKGANWIPADAVLSVLPDSRYVTLLNDAAKVHMNMLRLWGGGIFERDIFYNTCDELGILIWHDFMFACAAYPAFDASFVENVRQETIDNVRKIRHHPCIALWCGNNEIEQGHVEEKWGDNSMSWTDYKRLFDDVIPEAVKQVDPAGTYWPSSPHTPLGDRMDFDSPASGDAHLWDVWHKKKPFEWYRTTTHRFVSEFGFQSFCEPKTTNSYTEPEDRNITSYVMEHHQRSDIGNSTVMHYMLDWFRVPSNFNNILWVSQILQAMAIKYAVEHWRRNMPQTMGALYWQLNDTWPGPSWSSIDYFCRWKALHYAAAGFFAPLLISGVEKPEKGEVEIFLTSDLREKTKVEACYEVTNVKGTVLDKVVFSAEAAPGKSRKIKTISLRKIIARYGTRNLLVWLKLAQNGASVSSNLVLFERPKYLELANPGIKYSISNSASGNSYTIKLQSKAVALWVWLEIKGSDAGFSDNFFHLRPGIPVTVTVTPQRPLLMKDLRNNLIVRSLYDTYDK